MRKLIAKLFGLYTKQDHYLYVEIARQETEIQRRRYYQQVLDHLQRNGTLPTNCDLVIPKQSLIITNPETKEVIAHDGKWKRLPMDGEPVVITYKQND